MLTCSSRRCSRRSCWPSPTAAASSLVGTVPYDPLPLRAMKFIHTADWQLGMTRHFLSGEAQPRFSGARLDAVRRIGELAVEEGCEFVVVCGDVFESNQIDRQVLVRTLDVMASTPRVTFYLLPGNHDPLDVASIYRSGRFGEHKPANVVVLGNSQPVLVAEGIELVAAPWTSKRPLCDLVDQACALGEPTEALRKDWWAFCRRRPNVSSASSTTPGRAPKHQGTLTPVHQKRRCGVPLFRMPVPARVQTARDAAPSTR